MAKKHVGGFTGEPVYGAAGDWRYEHPDGTVVHVGRGPEGGKVGSKWEVAVEAAGSQRGAKRIELGLEKREAFQRAYGWMEGYDPRGEGGFGFDVGSGDVGGML